MSAGNRQRWWTHRGCTDHGSRAKDKCSLGDLHLAASKDCRICACVADLVAVGRVWVFVIFGIRTKPQGGGYIEYCINALMWNMLSIHFSPTVTTNCGYFLNKMWHHTSSGGLDSVHLRRQTKQFHTSASNIVSTPSLGLFAHLYTSLVLQPARWNSVTSVISWARILIDDQKLQKHFYSV